MANKVSWMIPLESLFVTANLRLFYKMTRLSVWFDENLSSPNYSARYRPAQCVSTKVPPFFCANDNYQRIERLEFKSFRSKWFLGKHFLNEKFLFSHNIFEVHIFECENSKISHFANLMAMSMANLIKEPQRRESVRNKNVPFVYNLLVSHYPENWLQLENEASTHPTRFVLRLWVA